MIGRNSKGLKPQGVRCHCSIHKCTSSTGVHTSSHHKRGIRTITNKDLISIPITCGIILCCHYIRCPWCSSTSCCSFINCSNIELWTIIWISANISNYKRLTCRYIKIFIIIRSNSRRTCTYINC